MSIIRFVHAADLHLDSPFKGLAAWEPAIANRLQRATFDAYENIIQLCLDERVDALLVAGDIYDGADRSLRAQLRFVDGLRRLDDAGIRSFICHGNHDPLDGWEAGLTLPAGCYRFGSTVEQVPVFEDDPERVLVHGISYPRREVRENLIPQYGESPSGRFNIGLIHANVDSDPNHDPYAPCSLSDLERTGIQYWALGHVHTHRVLREANPTVVYPGNPQGRHPNENAARGVYLVDVTDSGNVRTEFRPMDVVRWETVHVDIGNMETEQHLLDTIDQELNSYRGSADGRSLVIRIAIAGRGPLHATLGRPDFVEQVREEINENWSHQTPFVWCDKIQDSTGSTFDRQSRLEGTDFVADLLRLRDSISEDKDSLSELRHAISELYNKGNASKYLRDFLPDGDDLKQLVAEAEELSIAELLNGEDSE